jgi:hypothetical protein
MSCERACVYCVASYSPFICIAFPGISAIGIEALTSSFNITTDVSQKAAFNGAVGFTRADSLRAIEECVGFKEFSAESDAIIATLTRWCDGFLFSPQLDANEGMLQPAMVVQLLDAVLALNDKSRLHELLERWIPSSAGAAMPDRELMDYYAPSAAMATLLPKVFLGKALVVPAPLADISVQQQIVACTPAVLCVESDLLALALQGFDEPSAFFFAKEDDPVSLSEAEGTIVRTLFYEGLLTHAAKPCSGLRVSNDYMQQRFFDKFAQHLTSDLTLLKAAEDFILRGTTKGLEAALSASSAPGLIWQGVYKWLELDCSQRLRLLLSVASQSTHFRWYLEEPTLRFRVDGSETCGRTDISGVHVSGRRVVHVEVKHVHAVWDLEAFSLQIDGTFNPKNATHQVALMRFAKHLQRMKTADLLALKLLKTSIKRVDTARDVLAGAEEQARDYARGWAKSHAGHSDPPQLDSYAAIVFGPLRWVIVPVSIYECASVGSVRA